jgi:hypothetical protein
MSKAVFVRTEWVGVKKEFEARDSMVDSDLEKKDAPVGDEISHTLEAISCQEES